MSLLFILAAKRSLLFVVFVCWSLILTSAGLHKTRIVDFFPLHLHWNCFRRAWSSQPVLTEGTNAALALSNIRYICVIDRQEPSFTGVQVHLPPSIGPIHWHVKPAGHIGLYCDSAGWRCTNSLRHGSESQCWPVSHLLAVCLPFRLTHIPEKGMKVIVKTQNYGTLNVVLGVED